MKVLVVGATGQVGSQVVRLLAGRGHELRALIRSPNRPVRDVPDGVQHLVGDLGDSASMRRALDGVDAVVNTANGILPRGGGRSLDPSDGLVTLAEEAGVTRFVQASVPVHPLDRSVPELVAKRRIEARLADSPMASIVVRNPAFMDVWLPLVGARRALGTDPHASLRRPFGFLRTWLWLAGDLAERWGLVLAPGGAQHGSPLIATRDVAELLAAAVDAPTRGAQVWEAGGPAWVTWREVATELGARTGRRMWIVPVPRRLVGLSRWVAGLVSPSVANVLGLLELVASYQPRWEGADVVREHGLRPQLTVGAYLDATLGPVVGQG
ncbi:MAG: NmrA family NAD(P)-binding protein [Myxococcota bacterium]